MLSDNLANAVSDAWQQAAPPCFPPLWVPGPASTVRAAAASSSPDTTSRHSASPITHLSRVLFLLWRAVQVDNETLYKTLGVSKDASADDIRKAYRKIALKEHPDKGGDPEKFKAATKAYEILSNPDKRRAYDQHGEDGVDGSEGGGGMDPSDMFSSLFGGGGRRRGGGGPRKGEDIVHALTVSLNDICNGRSIKLGITRDITCKVCSGSGGADGAVEKECSDCRGQGMRMTMRQIGPGMIQQMTSPCSACRGTGRILPDDKKCKTCIGKKTVKEKKVLEVAIEKGMKHGQKIVFRGEAGNAPGVEPGDVVFVVQVAEHPVYARSGNDLIMEKDIALVDALCGVSFVMQHLDGRKIRVTSAPGELIHPGAIKMVEGAGLPHYGANYKHGDLIIRFNVVFPPSSAVTPAMRTQLKALIPRVMEPSQRKEGNKKAGDGRRGGAGDDEEDGDDSTMSRSPTTEDTSSAASSTVEVEDDGTAEDATLVNVDLARKAAEKEEAARGGHGGEAYNEDEDEQRGPRMQCAQQ